MKRYPSLIFGLLALPAAYANVSFGPRVTISSAADSTNQAAWWVPLDEFGGYDWLAYLRNPPSGSAAYHEVMVARRDTANGAIIRDCLKTSSGSCATFVDDIGHNTPSVAVDGDGFVHVFTGLHNDEWKYFRSTEPFSSTTLVDVSSEMPDQSVQFTYPVLKRAPSGDLWLIIRGEDASTGERARGGYFYRYSTSSQEWSRVSIWAYNVGHSVYPDDIQFSSDGDVHLQWEWCKFPASQVRHEGSYVRYTPSTDTYRSVTGDVVSVPITQDDAGIVFQPLTSGETYDGDINASPGPAFQSAKMAIYEDPSSDALLIHHAYRFKNTTAGPWQVRRARGTFGAGAWTREILHASTDTTAALGFTHDGSVARIYYCRVGGSAYVLEKNGNSAWVDTQIAPVASNRVERVAARMRGDGTDVLYLGAPTNVNSSTGSVYLLEVSGRS